MRSSVSPLADGGGWHEERALTSPVSDLVGDAVVREHEVAPRLHLGRVDDRVFYDDVSHALSIFRRLEVFSIPCTACRDRGSALSNSHCGHQAQSLLRVVLDSHVNEPKRCDQLVKLGWENDDHSTFSPQDWP